MAESNNKQLAWQLNKNDEIRTQNNNSFFNFGYLLFVFVPPYISLHFPKLNSSHFAISNDCSRIIAQVQKNIVVNQKP